MRLSPIFVTLLLFSVNILQAQDYPPNPKPGMCYIRCKKESVEEKVSQIIVPAYKKYTVVPAVTKSVEEQLIIKPATKKFEYVPAVYRDVMDSILVEAPINKITLIPVKTVDTIAIFEVQPAYSQFESRPGVLNCKSKNPRDCDVICYVEHAAVKKEIPVKKIVAYPTHSTQKQRPKYKYIKRKELVSEATVRETIIPAEYLTVRKTVLIKDETIDSSDVDAVVREEIRLVRDETSGGTGSEYVWEEIDCNLTALNILPIYYDFNSDLLTEEAKSVVTEKLFKLMVQKPLIRIEINSHTDSRASKEFNIDLSERRALAVVNYLVSKGIKRSRLEYHGLGESELVNRCADGVECSEEEHAKNRRTEFRVLPN